ncbi:amine oxidase [Plakobranchus ocellatus]|uniref:Amine oxidase n=1 Tax=Plakobranchus ocellatus TaxID=259542 RepID=A0AAV4BS57_9GAST|nr:amine oxidase [Plakobranchus ocellatus]
MLEDDSHAIDLMLGQAFSKPDSLFETGKHSPDFDEYVRKNAEKLELQERISYLEGCVAFAELEGQDTEEYERELRECQAEVDSFLIKDFAKGKGPIYMSLESVLEASVIVPQAYHSRSFIGNHCHKYIPENVYTNITKHVVFYTAQLTTDQNIIDRAYFLREKFDALNRSFATVHSLVSHTHKIDPSMFDTIKSQISSLLLIYRRHSHNTITPKLHMFEHHRLPFIKKWGFGLGLLGEQGGEMIHATIAKIERRMVGMRNKGKQIKTIVETHRLQNAPTSKTLAEHKTKKRKKQNK